MSGAIAKRKEKVRKESIRQSLPIAAASPAAAPSGGKPWLWFLGLALIFLGIECLVPLGSAIKTGADEDFELSKTLLYLKGYHFYSQVWNDEPPLYPFLLAQIVGHLPHALYLARLLTVGFALVLCGGLFGLSLRLFNLRTAIGAVIFVMASPSFLELASSCMVEIPTLAGVVAALALLSWPGRLRFRFEIGAGALFGLALQMKVIAIIYLPLTLLLIWLLHRPPLRRLGGSALIIGLATGLSFMVLNTLTGCSLWLQLQQAWVSHFSGVKSLEYGSPADHAFDWKLLLKNWDLTVPVIMAAGFFLSRMKSRPGLLFPAAWLILTLAIVSTHTPWWANYYLHNALPLAWCAAIALDAALTWARPRKGSQLILLFYLLGAGAWMGTRVYLQVISLRQVPRIFNCLVLSQIERYRPFTRYMFTDQGVYSFHAGIPLPPSLADISLKRLWSGDMTNAKLAAQLAAIKPGIILVANQTYELPYQDLLAADYRLVYQDNEHQLYVLPALITQANP